MQFLCINQLINLIFDVVNKVELVDKVKIVGQRLRGQRGGFSRTLLTTDELLGKRQTDMQNHANAVTLFYHLLLSLTLIINIIQFQFHRGTQLQDLVIGTVGCLLALLKIFGTLHGFPVYLSIYVPHPVPSRVLCMCRGGAAVYGVWLCPGIPRHNLRAICYIIISILLLIIISFLASIFTIQLISIGYYSCHAPPHHQYCILYFFLILIID